MSYFLYSPEPLPNPAMIGKPGYTPDSEYVGHAGWRITVEANKWIELPRTFRRFYHADWTDKRGRAEVVYMEDIAPAVQNKFGVRGLIVIDHEPTAEEKKKLEAQSADTNLAWRMRAVEEYEERLKQKAVGEKVQTRVTPYEDQCYEILGLTKPYSVEAMRAQRHPGEAVGEQIVAALDRLMKRKDEEAHKVEPKTTASKQPAPAGV